MSPRKKTGKNSKDKTDEVFIPDKLYFRIGESSYPVPPARLRIALLGE